MNLRTIILAAGRGTRMRSSLPKVLQPLAGRPLLEHVINVADELEPTAVHVVYGFGGDQVQEVMAHRTLEWHEQAEQLGTGHAVDQAMGSVDDDDVVLVLYGDVPLIQLETLQQLVHLAGESALALLTVKLDNPYGYGRIVRDAKGHVLRPSAIFTKSTRVFLRVKVVCCAVGLMRWIIKTVRANII